MQLAETATNEYGYQNRKEQTGVPLASEYDIGWVQPEKIEISDYELLSQYDSKERIDNTNEFPIKFYKHKENDSLLLEVIGEIRIALPPAEYFPPEVQEMITPWEEAEKQVMIDRNVLDLIVKIARFYAFADREKINNIVVIGPPAVSKTYVAGWIMSAMLGQPYYSTTFGPGTETPEVIGGPALKSKQLRGGSVRFILDNEIVREQRENDSTLDRYLTTIETKYESDSEYVLTNEFEVYIENVFRILDWGEAWTRGDVGWEDTELMIAYMMGCWIGVDEMNRMPNQNVLTDFLDPAQQDLSVPGRQGKIKGSPAGTIVGTQNTLSQEGTSPTPQHLESRQNAITVTENNLRFYVDLYTFFLKGDNPEFMYNGTKYQGRTDTETSYRNSLEKLPPKLLDELINTLSRIHMTLVTMVKERKIGRSKIKEGGNYIFDQRDIRNILNSITEQWKGRSSASDNIDNRIKQSDYSGIASIVRAALQQRYVDGVSHSDQPVVQELIDGMPIWDKLDGSEIHNVGKNSVTIRPDGALSVRDMILETGTSQAPYTIITIPLPKGAKKADLADLQLIPEGVDRGAVNFMFDLIDAGDLRKSSVADKKGVRRPNAFKITAQTTMGEVFIDKFTSARNKDMETATPDDIWNTTRKAFNGG